MIYVENASLENLSCLIDVNRNSSSYLNKNSVQHINNNRVITMYEYHKTQHVIGQHCFS